MSEAPQTRKKRTRRKKASNAEAEKAHYQLFVYSSGFPDGEPFEGLFQEVNDWEAFQAGMRNAPIFPLGKSRVCEVRRLEIVNASEVRFVLAGKSFLR